MVVVVAGMPRSGSTWSFNVARRALSSKGSALRLMAADSLPEDVGMFIGHHARHLILKSHFPDAPVLDLLQTVAAKGIVTLRDPAEASRSWEKAFPGGGNCPISAWREWHAIQRKWFLEIPFSEIGSWGGIFKIQKHLTGKVALYDAMHTYLLHSKWMVRQQTRRLRAGGDVVDIGFSCYHKDTFYHRGHITS